MGAKGCESGWLSTRWTTTSWLVFGVVLLGCALRLYHVESTPLWTDELFTLRVVDAPLGRWHCPESNLPPLYYLLAHLCVQGGRADAGHIRWPALMAGLSVLPITWMLGRLTARPGVAMWSLLLASLSPWMIWYAQEARPYSVCMLVGAGCALCCLGYLRAPKLAWLLGLGAWLGLGLWSHPYVMGYGLAAALALRWEGVSWRRALLGPGIAVASYTPWLVFLWGHPPGPVGSERGFSWASIPYTFYEMLWGKSFGPTTAELHTASLRDLVALHPVSLALGVAVSVLALGVAWQSRTLPVGRVLLWLALLPLPLEWGASASIPHLAFNPRYAAASVVPLWVAIALGASLLGASAFGESQQGTAPSSRGKARPRLQAGLGTTSLALCLSLEIAGITTLLACPKYQKEAIPAAAEHIMADGRGELIVASDPLVRGLLQYYYRGKLPLVACTPDGLLPGTSGQTVPLGKAEETVPQGTSEGALPEGSLFKERLSPGSSPGVLHETRLTGPTSWPARIWVVESRPWSNPAWARQAQELGKSWRVLSRFEVPGVRSWLLERRPAAPLRENLAPPSTTQRGDCPSLNNKEGRLPLALNMDEKRRLPLNKVGERRRPLPQ